MDDGCGVDGAEGASGEHRGVLYPERLPEFRRIPAPPELEAFVRWFWISEWDLGDGRVSRQHVVAFPACNLVVEHDLVGVTGPTTRASHKDLVGRGWAVAALLRPAAVPAVVGDPAACVDGYRTSPVDDPAVAGLHCAIAAAMDTGGPGDERHAAAVAALGRWLLERVPEPDSDARRANLMAALADTRMDLTTASALAAELGVSTRTAQRLARRYVGVSPAAMIRRRRLQEAADRIRREPGTDLAAVAHDLGYADHAHLAADFRTVLGLSPSAYRRDARI